MKTKKRNAQDATLININALKKKVDLLQQWAEDTTDAVCILINRSALFDDVVDYVSTVIKNPNPGKQEKNMAKKKAIKKPVKSGKKGC